jgi:uncharacterized protein YyaL (SSP411 family)
MITSNSNKDSYMRNNLDRSSSPYLLQHAGNPVWWQEWSREVIEQAAREHKPLFVSIGYSTCHWCHVMAAEAFSDSKTAAYLNEHFISVKVDREQRPDIDQLMMHFIQSQSGSGGWPLNVFLTPTLSPVMALTYAPVKKAGSRMSFLEIATRVHEYLETDSSRVMPFAAPEREPALTGEEALTEELRSSFDDENGGFGLSHKFPPHTTLLFLLSYLTVKDDDAIRAMITTTLDAMMLRGLNDHLQGGIFRYCVDREWTIPHFEKMLYDQAMALWCYSLAYRVTGREQYKRMADRIVRCLDECFEDEGLYITAFNADTDHVEGATYLWSMSEIESVLDGDDLKRFREVYDISETGNFEGRNHLIRKNNTPLDDIEEKLLSARRGREQPSRDDKILCSVNALTAAAMIQAGHFLERPELEEKAAAVAHKLLHLFWDGSVLGHSLFHGTLQRQGFLTDAGAMLTLITMLYENDESWGATMAAMAKYVVSFREDDRWVESRADDFQTVYASWFDHPIPSGVSLAETGLTRAALLEGSDVMPAGYRSAYHSDFYNLSVLMKNGLFHVITSENHIPWRELPANTLQRRGVPGTDCYNGVCRML